MLDIWSKTQGETKITSLLSTIYRVVESQEQIATLGLVNNVHEQASLEELIETTKNILPITVDSLHYLLKTPFRYPPLPHGSRFGHVFEPSLFYGSLTISTALAETAYYRFVYLLGPETPFPSTITNEYSSFSIPVKSDQSILLDQAPFTSYESILISPSSYQATQQLGAAMRAHQIELFRYISARDPHKGKNIGIFTPSVFCRSKPSELSYWVCQSNSDEVGFLSKEHPHHRVLYKQNDFWENGLFPSPAT